MMFQDRRQAGIQLAQILHDFQDQEDVIVLGLPRGGVILAYEVARALGLSLDILVTRKIAWPNNPEYAIGAIDQRGMGIFDEDLLENAQIDAAYVEEQIALETVEAQRRLQVYRAGRAALELKGKRVILVDDGIATGFTMRAAIASVKARGACQIIVAVPVVAQDTLSKLQQEVDAVFYLEAPAYFEALGAFYKDFAQTEDEEVINLLKKR